MPMGPYKDFDECLKDQESKGKSKEDAGNICGAIKHKIEGMEEAHKGEESPPPLPEEL